jgi:hypothetical protein
VESIDLPDLTFASGYYEFKAEIDVNWNRLLRNNSHIIRLAVPVEIFAVLQDLPDSRAKMPFPYGLFDCGAEF